MKTLRYKYNYDLSSLTIGVPIRNEEKSLPKFIKSLAYAIEKLEVEFPRFPFEVIFCINDTIDKSSEILSSSLNVTTIKNSQIIESNSGKINAIQEIINRRILQNGAICFIDADVELDEFCVVNLLKELQINKKVFLAYSTILAKSENKRSFIQIVQDAHYSLRSNLNPRKYFHGRAYMMRNSHFLKNKPRTLSNHQHWRLNEGPLVDDIYLSRLIVHSYGLGSIKECKDSKLWFSSPKNLKDLYFGQRRLLLEIKRLNLLFPEHEYIQTIHFKKNIRWLNFMNTNFEYFWLYLIYNLLEESLRIIIRFEILLISIKLKKCNNIWLPLNTTKHGNIGKT